jgi:hypothetical protein
MEEGIFEQGDILLFCFAESLVPRNEKGGVLSMSNLSAICCWGGSRA